MRTLPLAVVLALAVAGRARAEDALPHDVEAAVQGMASDERTARQAAAESALALQHGALLAPLIKLLKDEYRVVREAAIQALAAREPKDERTKAARAIEARLKDLDRAKDAPEESAVVVQALHDLAQPTSIAPLLDALEPTTETDVAGARLMAVGNVPTKEAVEELIGYAARGRRGEHHRAAAIRALQYATGVKLSNLDAWHRWWSENKRTYDPQAAAAARQVARDEEAAKAQEKAERRARRGEEREKKGKDGGAADGGEKDGSPPAEEAPPR